MKDSAWDRDIGKLFTGQVVSRRSLLLRGGAALGALGAAGLLAACGGGDDDDDDDAGQVDAETTQPPAGTTEAAETPAAGETPAATEEAEATTPPESTASGEVTYAGARGLMTIDPRLIQNTEEINLVPLITEPLITLGPELELVPLLATEWEAVDDTTWEITLREGVTFHNGEPFDAEAVKFTFDEYHRVGEQFPWFYIWGDELPQAEVIDTYTVHLTSSKPIATTPRNLALMYMLPPEAASSEDFVDNLVGTGPYTFVEHQQDVRFVLEANPDYWGEPASIQRVVYRPIPDPSARLTAVQTGEVDIASNIPPDLVPSLEAAGNLTVYQGPGVRLAHYPFNFRNQDSPIADVQVRQALGHALNGTSIIQDVLNGAGQPLLGPVPSILFAAADLGGYPEQDPDQARAMLEEAGYPMDYELNLIYTEGEFIKDREVTEAIQAMLNDADINVNIETLESGAYTERRDSADWDIALNGFSAVNGDPGFFLSWATGPSFGYENPETEDVIAQAAETVDEDARAELYQQAQDLYWEDVPYLWGYTQTDTVAISNRVQGAEPLPNGWILFQQASLTE